MFKVLYYNYVPLRVNGVGGGVAVYLKNVLNYLRKHPEVGIEPVFISSGFVFDGTKKTFLRQEDKWNGMENYTIVNSPIIASQIESSSSIKALWKDHILYEIFDRFLASHNDIRVIHFNSFEGLSTNVLELKKKYPNIRFVHSVHDYSILCQNAKLWNKWNENCLYSVHKFQCQKCLRYYQIIPKEEYIARRMQLPEANKHSLLTRAKRKIQLYYCNLIKTPSAFNKLRKHNISQINRYSDNELCVSERVKEILTNAGVKKEIAEVNYIGTSVAEVCQYKGRTDIKTPFFTLLYMGYASSSKGFYFLLDALEKMGSLKPGLCKNIIIKLASKISDNLINQKLEKLKKCYHDIVVYNGYSHADFPIIMNNVNLGIVPPLWEDNLPQVAIEMIANGIPVMTSRNGGAHELNSSIDFSFSNQADFEKKIEKIYYNRDLLSDYWKNGSHLTTMEEHINSLIKIYTGKIR